MSTTTYLFSPTYIRHDMRDMCGRFLERKRKPRDPTSWKAQSTVSKRLQRDVFRCAHATTRIWTELRNARSNATGFRTSTHSVLLLWNRTVSGEEKKKHMISNSGLS